jgi:hypothetical protein
VKEKKMRRSEIITKKIIILVILSGFFNLLSYSFDQMVIQSELKNRDLERRIISSRIKLESLSYEIVTLTDLSFDIFKSSDYFYKHLPVYIFGSFGFLNNKEIQEFLGKEKSDKMGKNFLIKFDEMILDFNKKIDEIDKIFSSMFPLSKTVFSILDLKIKENILDTFNPVNEDKNENEKKIRDNENYRIYSLIYDKLETFESYEFHFDYHLDIAQEKYVKNFSNFYNLIDDYAEQQNKINYYILLSIISQILGILFILLLFKSMIFKIS